MSEFGKTGLVVNNIVIKVAIVHRHRQKSSKGRTLEYGRVMMLLPKELIGKPVLIMVFPLSSLLSQFPNLAKLLESEPESEA